MQLDCYCSTLRLEDVTHEAFRTLSKYYFCFRSNLVGLFTTTDFYCELASQMFTLYILTK